MEYKQFRIGNLLQDGVSKTLLKVIEVSEKDLTTYVIDRSMFPLKQGWFTEPIPLTKEWLLKLGFLLEEDLGDQQYFEHKSNSDYSVCFDHDDISFQRNTKSGYITMIYDEQHLQYVHQLQNLYFALSGEELTTKK